MCGSPSTPIPLYPSPSRPPSLRPSPSAVMQLHLCNVPSVSPHEVVYNHVPRAVVPVRAVHEDEHPLLPRSVLQELGHGKHKRVHRLLVGHLVSAPARKLPGKKQGCKGQKGHNGKQYAAASTTTIMVVPCIVCENSNIGVHHLFDRHLVKTPAKKLICGSLEEVQVQSNEAPSPRTLKYLTFRSVHSLSR